MTTIIDERKPKIISFEDLPVKAWFQIKCFPNSVFRKYNYSQAINELSGVIIEKKADSLCTPVEVTIHITS